MRTLFLMVVITILLLIATFLVKIARAETASWYSQKEFKMCMANGEVFNENNDTCASWFYPFGTQLKVTNEETGAFVITTVTDRGPAKRLVKEGRVIDLSRGAFNKICPLEKGLCPVKLEVIR